MGANLEISVRYVEPCVSTPGGVRTLGHFTMSVPPRKGETVVLEPTFRADPARYRVRDVIHHMPNPAEAVAVTEVTILVIPVTTRSDLDRAVTALCSPRRNITPAPRFRDAETA